MFDVSGYAQVSEAILMDEPMEEFAQLIAMWVRFHDARPDVGLAWFLQHYKDGKLRAAPVEPPVLSRQITKDWLDAVINDISVLSNKRPGGGYWSFLDGARALRDAILESLSQEASE
jgi:hypothetical protein